MPIERAAISFNAKRSPKIDALLRLTYPTSDFLGYFMASIAHSNAIAMWVQWVPPWQNTVYGSRNGPSAENSEVLPSMKVPPAMMSSLSYPGIPAGIGSKYDPIGDHCWMALQNAMTFLGSPSLIPWITSRRGANGAGFTS